MKVLDTFSSMRTFLIVWAGQLVSLLGSRMTRFALIIWAYQQTGDATTLALLGFFSYLPIVLVSPFAGVWVDRLDRRKVMILADSGAVLTTAGLLILYASGNLAIWHLYLAEGLSGFFDAFQSPAYIAASSLLVPKAHYGRASGLRSLALNAADVIAPAFAGLLLGLIGIQGVMVLDVITFFAAFGTLLVVRFPAPPVRPEMDPLKRASMREQLTFGFRYIYARKGLLGLLLIYTCINLFAALTYFGVMPAMILTRSGGDELALATVQGALGAAGVLGGIVVSLGGLPKRRIHAALGATAISFMGDFLFAVGRDVPVWVVAAIVASFFIPILLAGERAIWQTKVPPDVQGRVFAAQSMVRMGMMPLGYLLAGPLADRLFEPAMQPSGALAGIFGGLVGTGPGAGMGAMFLFTCIGGTLLCLSGYAIRPVRRVELDLPDFDAEDPAADSRATGKSIPVAI
jgi:DHA3 family macrolide efflux protein-like MFS transporter